MEELQIQDVASDSDMEFDRQRNHELRAMKNKDKELELVEAVDIDIYLNSRQPKNSDGEGALYQSVEYIKIDENIDDQMVRPEVMVDDSIGTLDSYNGSSVQSD